MVRVGLVAYVEEQLERDISLRRLPGGQFGSEEKLARSYGVSRGTVREALRRLAARGLVLQHPGRKTRALALDESLTLENLGLALHDERSPESRRLLEGYFTLKRQVLVELLADCCASASEAELDSLSHGCFALWDAARWEPGARCAQLEFELLRLAARTVDRPGHLLLIQSMQRAMLGLAERVLPLMGGEALRQWACCAMDALHERDTEALKHKLPALLRACDERVLGRLAPAPQGHAAPEAGGAQKSVPGGPASAHEADDAPAGCPTGVAEDNESLEVAPRPQTELLPVEPESAALLLRAVPGLDSCDPDGECAGAGLGMAWTNLSDCRTGLCAWQPEGSLQVEPRPADSRGTDRVAVYGEGCAPLAPPGPTPRTAFLGSGLQPLAISRLKVSSPAPDE